jgi:hypothetical protein
VFEYSQTDLDKTVKVSIPYDEGMYLLLCENGVAYDINAEYIDGCYVFETDQLGTFMFSTESTGRTEPTRTENIELAQQTIIDEVTGVQVSGMLPVDAEMDVLLAMAGDYRLHIFNYYDKRVMEEDYPKANNVSKFLYDDEEERSVDTEAGRLSGTFSKKGWTNYDGSGADGTLETTITFIKDYEILPKEGINIRLFFPKSCSVDYFITKLARELDIDFSICAGKLERFRDDVLGTLIINIKDEDKGKVLGYIASSSIGFEVIDSEV